MAEARRQPILEFRHVNKAFGAPGAEPVHVAKAVDLTIFAGETVALIGESGSGKSSLARMALGLLKPDTGEVRLLDQPINRLSAAALRTVRLNVQPVFQDSSAAFNPRRPVLQLLGQALRQPGMTSALKRQMAITLLEQVGLKPGADYLPRYAHELSGGQRQRLAIARAIAMGPALIIADEPLSGADVSIRGQILNLLIDLRETCQVAYLFITHDLLVARNFAHRVAVVYRGEIVEQGLAHDVLDRPQHAYTRRLVASNLGIDPMAQQSQARA
ncbi:MAG TPA: ATP-binding cassette domain-containing protein [Devosiaceae bacterium]|jgi:ABC-type glutathione transport system ATPase component